MATSTQRQPMAPTVGSGAQDTETAQEGVSGQTTVFPSTSAEFKVLRCVNTISKCRKPAAHWCSRCMLVKYCSKECQRVHWVYHRILCHSFLTKDSWDPAWFLDKRVPTFLAGDRGSLDATLGMNKYLWGNTPAFDRVKLASNEGEDWNKPLDILFAASGDLRDVVVTINSLPPAFRQPCNILINDWERAVVLRNLLLILTFAAFPPAEAAELGLHLWYSAKLPMAMLDRLRTVLGEKISRVAAHLEKTSEVPEEKLLQIFIDLTPKAQLRCILLRSYWSDLLLILDFKISPPEANRLRHQIALQPERLDHREKHLYLLSGKHRVSKHQYDLDGLLLPFGADRSTFTEANFTLFDVHDRGWLLKDSADVVRSWSIHSVRAAGDPRSNDIYGNLYFYLLSQFENFSQQLQERELNFTFISVDVREFRHTLETIRTLPQSFDRIDVSNLADLALAGFRGILDYLGDLLKAKNVNPHAALIMMFKKYHDEIERKKSPVAKAAETAWAMREAAKFYPLVPRDPTDPRITKLRDVASFLKDYEVLWQEYVEEHAFHLLASSRGIRIREKNTIIERRPYEVKKGGGNQCIIEQIEQLTIMKLHGHECYVECVREDEGESRPEGLMTDGEVRWEKFFYSAY